MGSLRVITAIVFVVETREAQRLAIYSLVQWNPLMTKGFEWVTTAGTGDRLGINSLLAAWTFRHEGLYHTPNAFNISGLLADCLVF